MEICHPHNLNQKTTGAKPYGIRVSLPPNDTFLHLLDKNWKRLHWFETKKERDQALEDMASEHLYSRQGDRPRMIFEAVETPKRPDSD